MTGRRTGTRSLPGAHGNVDTSDSGGRYRQSTATWQLAARLVDKTRRFRSATLGLDSASCRCRSRKVSIVRRSPRGPARLLGASSLISTAPTGLGGLPTGYP